MPPLSVLVNCCTMVVLALTPVLTTVSFTEMICAGYPVKPTPTVIVVPLIDVSLLLDVVHAAPTAPVPRPLYDEAFTAKGEAPVKLGLRAYHISA